VVLAALQPCWALWLFGTLTEVLPPPTEHNQLPAGMVSGWYGAGQVPSSHLLSRLWVREEDGSAATGHIPTEGAAADDAATATRNVLTGSPAVSIVQSTPLIHSRVVEELGVIEAIVVTSVTAEGAPTLRCAVVAEYGSFEIDTCRFTGRAESGLAGPWVRGTE